MNKHSSNESELVILVPGFTKGPRDMYTLYNYLTTDQGFDAVTVNLPTSFSSLEDCVKELYNKISTIIDQKQNQTVHLVGHSMGGLIIRLYLTEYKPPNLGRCVIIGTPNHGSNLADMVEKYFYPVTEVFKPIKSLTTTGKLEIPVDKENPPVIGVIAGNKNILPVIDSIFKYENDGRVEVESTKFNEMSDFIKIYYGHNEIHHQPETMELVVKFLNNGKFT